MIGNPRIINFDILQRPGPYTFIRVDILAENDDPALGHLNITLSLPIEPHPGEPLQSLRARLDPAVLRCLDFAAIQTLCTPQPQ